MATLAGRTLRTVLTSFSAITDIVGPRIQEAPAEEMDVRLGAITYAATGGGQKGPAAGNTRGLLPYQRGEFMIRCWSKTSEEATTLYSVVYESLTGVGRHSISGVSVSAFQQLGGETIYNDPDDGTPAVQAVFSFEVKT
ncbi:hypothetical protein LCGC14_2019910 [marine sediment metagenome]|uniref:Uncharacterized protein n=1 Tax=marine sediment metagenome TaxID=412755 RepID=A0A0F9EXW8_9ZZZZ